LWEDNGRVKGTGNRIKCDEAPKEGFPLLACETTWFPFLVDGGQHEAEEKNQQNSFQE
jgi:hypothetical protein